MSGLASMAGISVPSSGQTNSTAFIIETLKSRKFVKNLIKYDDVLPSIMAPKSFNHKTGEILFNPKLYNSSEKKWVRKQAYPYKTKPSSLEVHKELNDNILEVSVDKKTGYIIVSIEHISPIFAHDFLRTIIEELNMVSREKDLRESQEAINFLKLEASKSALSPLNNSISRLIESKLETQMMAQIHEDYLLRFIDPPYFPEKKSWPSRTNILIISFLMSFILSIFSFLILYFVNEDKE
tara:strand:+ start:20 stop:736 length:717 start_codon:yes stop_codon:yes gene_type:complete